MFKFPLYLGDIAYFPQVSEEPFEKDKKTFIVSLFLCVDDPGEAEMGLSCPCSHEVAVKRLVGA